MCDAGCSVSNYFDPGCYNLNGGVELQETSNAERLANFYKYGSGTNKLPYVPVQYNDAVYPPTGYTYAQVEQVPNVPLIGLPGAPIWNN